MRRTRTVTIEDVRLPPPSPSTPAHESSGAREPRSRLAQGSSGGDIGGRVDGGGLSEYAEQEIP
jgi:hypothetical protein